MTFIKGNNEYKEKPLVKGCENESINPTSVPTNTLEVATPNSEVS